MKNEKRIKAKYPAIFIKLALICRIDLLIKQKPPAFNKESRGIKVVTFTLTTSSLEGVRVRHGPGRSSDSPDLYQPSLLITSGVQ